MGNHSSLVCRLRGRSDFTNPVCHLKISNGDGGDSCIILLIMFKTSGISIASGVLKDTEYTHRSLPPVLFQIIVFGLDVLHLTGEFLDDLVLVRHLGFQGVYFLSSSVKGLFIWKEKWCHYLLKFLSLSLSVNASNTDSFTTVFRSSGSIFTLESPLVAIVEDLNLPLHMGYGPSQQISLMTDSTEYNMGFNSQIRFKYFTQCFVMLQMNRKCDRRLDTLS